MASVTVLTPAAQARTGTSSALDVSAYSTLRLDLTARADQGLSPRCTFVIETGLASTGPWRELHRRNFNNPPHPEAWPATGPERVVLSAFDNFVRCRWEAARQGETPYGPANPSEAISLPSMSLFLGLAGTALP